MLPVVGLSKHLVPRDGDPIVDLEIGGDRVGGVAAEDQEAAAREQEAAVGRAGIVDLVVFEDDLGDGLAHRGAVAGVGDEVDPEIFVHGLGEALGVGIAAELASHALGELVGIVGLHPVAAVDVLGGDDAGREVPEVAPERARAEPHDRAGELAAAPEAQLRGVLRRRARANRGARQRDHGARQIDYTRRPKEGQECFSKARR